MSDDNKTPQELFKEAIKTGVNAANSGLRAAQTTYQQFKEPVSSTLETAEASGALAVENVKTLYQKRKQYAPQIIAGTAATTGGYLWLRGGRIAGIFGAAVGTGAAYSLVYDEFPVDVEQLPDMIFGKK
mmetsp:Transcript_21710/g.45838  ORF Transcript_21710/g.45838 Transcript_21710/m.45838 type:complete len:129 (+) Transcript_21710:143-529(+)|eukprot:CAMPEP_0201123188 /NCGR_PEP_ID=MMETSP0850-20130426/6624_1 /ASSEMBLY_ACC=CAM_ASM_000622 /TAXON_ID=183588 /ORGANISM="Pseudo-nitzschia fraudulenta, Strain WWA7" /LENGTH=128 /DNA_ID=CAMNT_0047390039 /DNA_START=184 /DNA_END=570 /DNA_ORIENTATION=+